MRVRSIFATLAVTASLVLVPLSPAIAENLPVIDFNSYSLGTVNGQDGWSSLGAAGSGCAAYDHQIVDGTIYGYGAIFGARSLRMSNAVTSGCFGDQTFSKSLANSAGESSAENGSYAGGTRQSYFEAQWDFASTVPGAEQPGLSVVASPDRGDGARMSWIQMADKPEGLQINFNDYQRSFDTTCTTGDGFRLSNLVSGLSRNVPHTIKVSMLFVDGAANDVVKVYVDGILRGAGTSWEDYFRDCEGKPTRTVDSILFRTGGAAAPATLNNGFVIDNLRLASSTPSTLKGFFQPVDMSASSVVWNTVKGGSTVPLKFQIFVGTTEVKDTSFVVQPLTAVRVPCASGTTDDVGLTATGATSLRYDSTGGQFVYNWQTPKSPGSCYTVTVTTTDGSSISANFQLK